MTVIKCWLGCVFIWRFDRARAYFQDLSGVDNLFPCGGVNECLDFCKQMTRGCPEVLRFAHTYYEPHVVPCHISSVTVAAYVIQAISRLVPVCYDRVLNNVPNCKNDILSFLLYYWL